MLSRNRRLNRADFECAFAGGKQFRHPLLVLRCYRRAEEETQSQLRAAFVVPKKLAKATGRNRWRRRLRHWFYEILQEVASAKKEETDLKWNRCDLIFMLTAQGQDAAPQEVQLAMMKLLKKADLYPGRNTLS